MELHPTFSVCIGVADSMPIPWGHERRRDEVVSGLLARPNDGTRAWGPGSQRPRAP